MIEKYLKLPLTKLSSSDPPLRLKASSFVFKRRFGLEPENTCKFVDKISKHGLVKKPTRTAVKLTTSNSLRRLLKNYYPKKHTADKTKYKSVRTPLKLHHQKEIKRNSKSKQIKSYTKLFIAKSKIIKINNALKNKKKFILFYKNLINNSRNTNAFGYATNVDNGVYLMDDEKLNPSKSKLIVDKEASDDSFEEYSCRTVIEHECDNDYSLMFNGLNETFLFS